MAFEMMPILKSHILLETVDLIETSNYDVRVEIHRSANEISKIT